MHDLGKLADWLHDPTTSLSRAEVLTWLRDLLRHGGDEPSHLARQRRELPRKALARWQQWSFLADDATADPLDAVGPRRDEAVNRLGLGHLIDPGLEFMRRAHRLPDGSAAHRPTAWDAELDFPWWRPTGRSEPLDGSGSANGLPEAVHEPVGPESLVRPITKLEP